jgi:NTE family protein
MTESHDELSTPVRYLPTDSATPPDGGIALCLSGGGYRAMLFHAGVLWRINEAGWLPRLDRVSSVSGGSITAGVLALGWQALDFDEGGVAGAFADTVVGPLRDLAKHTIDKPAIIAGLFEPLSSIGDHVAAAYRGHLFGDKTLQEFPDRPRFVINSTNLASGELFRFSRPYAADWRVGRIEAPAIPIATAVACSSAFPPFLSPYRLDLSDATWATDSGNDLTDPDYRSELRLSDGGVYDNLGLETAWKTCHTVLVSDAGGHMAPEPEPPADWARHMLRVLSVIDNQVRDLRKRQVINGLASGDRDGVYVGIRSDVDDYHLQDAMPADPAITSTLATLPTRLAPIDNDVQMRLINWGYVMADTGLRRHLDPTAPKGTLPYPDSVLS